MDPTEIHLSTLESFSFDYVVRWPESLILSRKVSDLLCVKKNSLFQSVLRDFPDFIKGATSVETFKKLLKQHLFQIAYSQ